ncbi:SpvB/TcaC N-terminal domain-containing protein [Flavivirga eckloniae]|uniref:Sugar-binding protein n=1 Tax=Flavivirga eckloniae TaxID=1803846 RepID=A0A2K9PK51_9FLAO|nr:RHS repeat domain-containing protein [Flavivirga eckloniae]AUP77430.1 hypothetical protein C1H87_01320 [Flavivirga eckloniae]
MKKRSVYLVFSFVFLSILIAQAQLSNPATIPPSPQSEAFMKYGEYSINYSTGVPDISVPLHEIDHHGFKIPVSLSYYYQGVKPGYNIDVFGLGWGVNPTGKISREIRYMADEKNDFVVDVRDPFLYTHIMNTDFYNEPRSFNHSADLFHVSLPTGLSFDFTIVKSTSGDYNVYISNKEPAIIKHTTFGVNNELSWEIIDKNGIKYTFSGDDGEKVLYGGNNDVITTWNLSSIKLPNSNELITYNYREGILNGFTEDNVTASVTNLFDANHCNDIPKPLEYQTDLLDRIEYGNTYINFTYNTNLSHQYVDHNFIKSISIGETGGKLIKKITFNMSDQGNKIPLYSIPLMRLNSIAISGSPQITPILPPKIYNFSYGPMTTFSTRNTDHWGYLNNEGNSPSGSNFPEFSIYLFGVNTSCYTGATEITPGHHDPNIKEYKLGDAIKQSGGQHGTLNKIIYPTGGYTEFTFEKNYFGWRTPSDFTSLNSNHQGAGFRIAQIANYDSGDTLLSNKIYKYGALVNPDSFFDPIHTDMGVAPVEPNALSYLNYKTFEFDYTSHHKFLKEWPQTGSPTTHISVLLGPGDFEHIFNNSVFKSILNGRPSVVYPEVTVYTGEFGSATLDKTLGKTVYKYDYFDEQGDFIEPWVLLKDGQSYYIPKTHRYNKLLEQIDYKREDITTGNPTHPIRSVYTPVRKIENKWIELPGDIFIVNKFLKVVPNMVPHDPGYTNPYFYSNHTIYKELYFTNLSETITTNYISSTDSIQTKEKMTYSGNFLIRRETTNSDNKKNIQSYRYVAHEVSPPVIETMRSDAIHMISPIIESITRLKEGTNAEILISGTKTDYKEFTVGGNPLFVPEKQVLIDKSNVETTELTILSYTANGKPKEVQGKDGIITSYLWGYNDRYPVAKVENATISTVEGQLTATELAGVKNGTYDRANMVSTLNKIRTGLGLGNFYMVTTYTYDPLIGMTSMTDPKGETIYYDYDHFGRLKDVKDAAGKILSHTNYHYKNQ